MELEYLKQFLKEEESWEITVPDFKISYKATVILVVGIGGGINTSINRIG